MQDCHQRTINYLRISLTDRCNLRCTYCMPAEGVKLISHHEILRLEEIAKIVELLAPLGISHIRLTGGEPLVRKGLIELIEQIAAVPGIEDIALTTNATLLGKTAHDLKRAGLTRVNISLDSLDPDLYRIITRNGDLNDALAGIEAAFDAGFSPIKLNTVVARHFNQDLLSFAKLTLDRPLHVRFIEYMPVGEDEERTSSDGETRAGHWSESSIIPAAEILETIDRDAQAAGLGALNPLNKADAPLGFGPARYYQLPSAQGSIGVISAISNHFCGSCNRLRITADGKLRPCLFSDTEYDLKEALRSNEGDSKILEIFETALIHKPLSHNHRRGTKRKMSQLGG